LDSPPPPRSYIRASDVIALALPPSASRRYTGPDPSSLFMHSTTRLYSVGVCATVACQVPSGDTRSSTTLTAFVRVLQSSNLTVTHSCSAVGLRAAQPQATRASASAML